MGIKEEKEAFVSRLIKKSGFTDEQIIELAEVPHSLVRRIRKKTYKIH